MYSGLIQLFEQCLKDKSLYSLNLYLQPEKTQSWVWNTAFAKLDFENMDNSLTHKVCNGLARMILLLMKMEEKLYINVTKVPRFDASLINAIGRRTGLWECKQEKHFHKEYYECTCCDECGGDLYTRTYRSSFIVINKELVSKFILFKSNEILCADVVEEIRKHYAM